MGRAAICLSPPLLLRRIGRRALVHSGQAEYIPISLTQIPRLIANGRLRTDVAFVQVSPPDAHGFVSLGTSVDITMSVLRYAKTIVAEVNPFMPRTLGDTFLHVDRIDRFVRVERPLAEYAHQPADAVTECIARYVAEILRMVPRYTLLSGVFPMRLWSTCIPAETSAFARTSSPPPSSISLNRA